MGVKKENITCVMCCTKNWYYYLSVAVYSLIITNKVKKIYLVIEDDEISDINVLCNKYNVKVEYLNINNIENYIKETSPNYNTKYSKLSMCRLYFTKIINEDKVLYIDADAIVLDDISELWNTEFEDKVLVGVKEPNNWDRHLNTSNLNDNYINSGVLLMNLKALKEEELDESMLYLINNHKYEYPDQDVINLVCRNRIKYISNEYNSAETMGIAEHIRIMHYIRGNKGWISSSPFSLLWSNKESELLELGIIDRIKVKAIISLSRDNESGIPRKVGDTWYVSKERYDYLSGNNPKKIVAVERV